MRVQRFPRAPAHSVNYELLHFVLRCWAVNENMNYWWIIRFPILLVSLVRTTCLNSSLRLVIRHPGVLCKMYCIMQIFFTLDTGIHI